MTGIAAAPQGQHSATSESRVTDPWWRERVAHRSLPQDVAQLLVAARKRRGWSIRRAAREIGCSDGSVGWRQRHGCRRWPWPTTSPTCTTFLRSSVPGSSLSPVRTRAGRPPGDRGVADPRPPSGRPRGLLG